MSTIAYANMYLRGDNLDTWGTTGPSILTNSKTVEVDEANITRRETWFKRFFKPGGGLTEKSVEMIFVGDKVYEVIN